MNATPNAKAAQEVHHKLEFYLVALVFTALAFSIQSARFTGQVAPDVAELVAWVSLLLSGLLGLSRLEYLPVIYRTNDAADAEEHGPNVVLNPTEMMEMRSESRRIEARNRHIYFWQKALLVAGFFVLGVSRSWIHVEQLLTSS